MIQEDKEFLLKDLLARLPYGVKIRLGDYDYQVCGYNSEKELPVKIWFYYDSNLTLKSYIDVYLTDYRPYLRPMSSMTEEEKNEFINHAGYEVEESVNGRHYEYYLKDFVGTKEEPIANVDAIDWLNTHHFDYRGLIPKGLAIEVTKENNPYKD